MYISCLWYFKGDCVTSQDMETPSLCVTSQDTFALKAVPQRWWINSNTSRKSVKAPARKRDFLISEWLFNSSPCFFLSWNLGLPKYRKWLWENWCSVKKKKKSTYLALIWQGNFFIEELELYKYVQVNIHNTSLNTIALRPVACTKWHLSALGNFSYTKRHLEKLELHFHKGSCKPGHPVISMRNILQIPPRKCNIQCIISLWYMEPWNKQ